MIKSEYKYSELTGKIIGCAIEVHNALGNGFQEVIYQRALAIEMTKQGLGFKREMEIAELASNKWFCSLNIFNVVFFLSHSGCLWRHFGSPERRSKYPCLVNLSAF